MSLSVVVVRVSGKREDLENCLAALRSQRGAPELDVIVPGDEGLDAFAQGSHRRFDLLRASGLRAARGSVIAMTEDHAVATPTWAADLLAVLEARPRAAAAGGAIECGAQSLLARAVYYCDFGRYQNPLEEGPARYVSDSNIAYRREALEQVRDAWNEGYRETVVHGALVARGFEIVLTRGAAVEQRRSGLRLGPALRERIVWGRAYAAARVEGSSAAKRALLAIGSPLLPFLLTFRLLRGRIARRRDVGRFLACLPLVFLLEIGWALGELQGYATGSAERA